ncbi:MAG: alpha/beta fold hydrolase [Opitutae bacterium]|nr:alpha/beta fold hydrolase [Opitutae bacterium]
MSTAKEIPFQIKRGPHRLAAVLHDAGKARLVVLCHGFTGDKAETSRLFVTTARALADVGISALRFDFMGSGDSTGDFHEMTPNTEIADLHAVLDWARRAGYRQRGVLGISFGGAVSICTVAQRKAGDIAALCTWSSVPAFSFWRPKPDPEVIHPENLWRVGRRFFNDRPKLDVPESYRTIRAPKLQVQGDCDLEGFREEFTKFFPSAPEPKRHVVVPGADHVFTKASLRKRVIRETVKFFRTNLG